MPQTSSAEAAPKNDCALVAAAEAELVVRTPDLQADVEFLRNTIGMRMNTIYPADSPAVATFVGHGLRLQLKRSCPESGAAAPPAPTRIRLLSSAPTLLFPGGENKLVAPSGAIEVEACDSRPPKLEIPQTQHKFEVCSKLLDSGPWVIGRAGMHYRDLLPSRLGGAIIASHIRIPDGGPVPDNVHYHVVGFQLIYCYKGWVRLVYEDQGPPFILNAGCCVIQPPEIRHRVLESSDGLEVVEIGVPAEHITTLDWDMELPSNGGVANTDRQWQGQKFLHHKEDGAQWGAFRIPGFVSRDTGVCENTQRVAGVHVAKIIGDTPHACPWHEHTADILFTFVLEGSLKLEVDHDPEKARRLSSGDAFTIPPGLQVRFAEPSADLQLLEVALPGKFETRLL